MGKSGLKILIHSNAPWAGTGYGTQCAVLIEQFKHLGHTVMVSAFYGLQGARLHLPDVPVLPSSKDSYGNDMLLAHVTTWKPDVVVTLLDIWVLNPELLQKIKPISIIPVDHDPIPQHVVNGCKAVGTPIAMSRFGLKQMKAAGVENAVYIPHALNMDLYQVMERDQAREKVGLPKDKFIAGMVLANKGAPSRKAFDQQIRAFARFHEKHPDSMLYMHTDMQGWQGENLHRIIELCGLDQKAVGIADQYRYLNGMYPQEEMVTLYNSFDVLLNATRGEGFGLPILEAQACGTPVIVTDFSSMPELCGSGWKVGYVDKLFTGQDSYQVIPSVDEIVEALEKAYLTRGDNSYRDSARRKAVGYGHLHVADAMWKPLLNRIKPVIFEPDQPLIVIEPPPSEGAHTGAPLQVPPGHTDKADGERGNANPPGQSKEHPPHSNGGEHKEPPGQGPIGDRRKRKKAKKAPTQPPPSMGEEPAKEAQSVGD